MQDTMAIRFIQFFTRNLKLIIYALWISCRVPIMRMSRCSGQKGCGLVIINIISYLKPPCYMITMQLKSLKQKSLTLTLGVGLWSRWRLSLLRSTLQSSDESYGQVFWNSYLEIICFEWWKPSTSIVVWDLQLEGYITSYNWTYV